VEVILLDRISKLGELGEKVKVKAGFGRNYLIPQGKALPATKPNLELFEARRAELEKVAKQRLEKDQQRALVLEGVSITIAANSGEEGRLFGSVGTHEIVHAMKEMGHEIAKSEIQLPEGPFRHVGNYEVELYLHGNDVVAKIQVNIVAA
jgi:large subunit ribosomal protein L9